MIALLLHFYAPVDQITVQKGDFPLIITAPHGGIEAIPDCEPRKDKYRPQFTTVLDTRTDKLALAIATEVYLKSGGHRPWVVVANFSRKYADVNRPIEDGTESEPARRAYRAYHEAVRKAVDELRKQFGKGFLIDVHGQGATNDSVYRGTRNWESVNRLISKKGKESIEGPNGLLGLLSAKGMKFIPTIGGKDRESKFDGGYTMATYGCQSKNGIDAMQLEFGGDYRSIERIEKTADQVGDVMVLFIHTYVVDYIDVRPLAPGGFPRM